MDKESLKTLRDEINDIDNQLLSLIVKRTNIVEKIGLIKKNPDLITFSLWKVRRFMLGLLTSILQFSDIWLNRYKLDL